MANIKIEYDERDLKELILKDLENKNFDVTENDIEIVTKSKQNYKSEWENAEYKATVSVNERLKRFTENF